MIALNKILLTGATGMVGEGVLHQCVLNPNIQTILVLGRKPCGYNHPKVKDVLVTDFMNLNEIESQLNNLDACLYCAGTSSVGMSKEAYFNFTYNHTLNVANTLARLNNAIVFCYISGAGTNSAETGKADWANTKGKTENDLAKLPFKAVYNFRPGALLPTLGLKNTLSYYKYFMWLAPVLKLVASNYITTLAQLGNAMINACSKGYTHTTIEVKDIKLLST
jgi:uncharacterized protein YbjT (DUF2867 family)